MLPRRGGRLPHPARPLIQHRGNVRNPFSCTAIVAPGFRMIQKLQLEIQNLPQTRDLLLPRLLAGQVELSAGKALS